MKKLPEFFSTQHQLRQLSVMDESPVSTLFGVVDSSNKPMTVELFESNHRGAVKQAAALSDVRHRSIAPLVGTGTTEKGQDFLVRAALSGEPLSTFTGSGLGAQHLTKTEALSVFTPLAEAVDYLLQNNQTGFAMHALHPRRIMVTGSRSNAVLCAAGPGVGNVTAEQVTQRFAELIKSAHPEFKPDSQFHTAGSVIDVLRNASTSTGTAAAVPVEVEALRRTSITEPAVWNWESGLNSGCADLMSSAKRCVTCSAVTLPTPGPAAHSTALLREPVTMMRRGCSACMAKPVWLFCNR